MANVGRCANRLLVLRQHIKQIERNVNNFGYTGSKSPKNHIKYLWAIGSGVVVAAIHIYRSNSHAVVHASTKKIKQENEMTVKLTSRERRFLKFASAEFNGQIYMTPQDFLDSVVEQEPRPRLKRRTLTEKEINDFHKDTPSLKKGKSDMFRKLRDRGIISYTEYLFLLSILIKPVNGFRIAFNMFDTDGNQRVDKSEFLVLLRILGGTYKEQKLDENTRKVLLSLMSSKEQMQSVLGIKTKQPVERPKGFFAAYVDDNEGLQRRHQVITTLQYHFFGKKGTDTLDYKNFHKFMDNLQSEVLELEFSEFSKGKPVITELDFAKILLRYTYLNTESYDAYLERLLGRVTNSPGITFTEFRDFCRFLNNLEDFSMAMRMYTLADQAISQGEFQRAVKICTGYNLSKHVINTVFSIFDEDGDGLLSYKEFMAIMKDRVHRGLKSVARSEGWEAFKVCVKQEMKSSERN